MDMSKKIFSVSEEAHYSDLQPKIEIVNCPNDKSECVAQLPVINQHFHESHDSFLNKDYKSSIAILKRAYDTTYEIQESSCKNCTGLFRSTIISSLENIHLDLQKMTTGWFKSKRFRSSYELSALVLEELRQRNEGPAISPPRF